MTRPNPKPHRHASRGASNRYTTMRPPKSFQRAAHGNGAPAVVRIEQPPPDELSDPSASPLDSVRPERGADGRFAPGNAVARSKKIRAGAHGALVALEAKADPAWRALGAWARRYSSHRRAELAASHGGHLSAGVSAMVDDAASIRGDAKYIAARARAEGNTALSKQAASMLAEAKQLELAAWELASREAKVRPVDPMAAHRALEAAFGAKS